MEHVKPALNTPEFQKMGSSASTSVAQRDKATQLQDQTRCWIKMGNAMINVQIILIKWKERRFVLAMIATQRICYPLTVLVGHVQNTLSQQSTDRNFGLLELTYCQFVNIGMPSYPGMKQSALLTSVHQKHKEC